MLFLHAGSLARVRAHKHSNIGRLIQPHDFSRLADTLADGYRVAVDNGAYNTGNLDAFARMISSIRAILDSDLPVLRRLPRHHGLPTKQSPDPRQPNPFAEPPTKNAPPANLLWIVVPDVSGDAAHTFSNFQWLAPLLSDMPLAYAVQDGSGDVGIPFESPNLRCLFLAGSDDYRESEELAEIAAEGKRRGLWIHGAPCNAARRAAHFAALGCDSFDGTGASKWPSKIPTYLEWTSEPGHHPDLA